MADLRLPEPMTPERADMLAERWRLAVILVVAAGFVMLLVDVPTIALVVWWLPLAVCVGGHARCRAWRDGYRAGRTEELRRSAGELL